MRHQFAGQPQVEQCQPGILAGAIAIDARVPIEITVSQRSAGAQFGFHLCKQTSMSVGKSAPTWLSALPLHDGAPVRKFSHRLNEQRIAKVKSLTALKQECIQMRGREAINATQQRQLMATRNNTQRVQLHALDSLKRLNESINALPAPPGP